MSVQASTQERHDAITDPIGRLLLLSLGEVLPGARVLDWHVQPSGIIGRAAAEGLVYCFRTDANQIAYRPAWPDLTEAQWEARSSGFLLIRNPEQRQDFKGVRFQQKRSRRQCSKGYGCGSACIALAKECRITPASAISKQRLSALQTLVREGDPRAQAMAAQVAGARLQQAGSVRDQRQVDRLRKMLQDPEVAAMVRSGRIPGGPGNSPVNDAPLAGTVQVVSPSQINVDPKRFQYKIVSNAAGEVGSLRDVRKWDDNLAGVISVWQDPANGKTFVVNGHNRLGLARRQGVEGVTVRYLKAANATEARAIGAMQNIAEGQGTEVDAAKFFRDSGIRNREDVEARGLPLTSGKAAKGLALARLPREMFDRVVQGDLSVNRGAIIGGSGLDAAKQREIGKLLKTRPSVGDGTLGEYVEALAASQRQQQQTINLFGTSTEEVDTGLARAELVNGITRKIGRERRLFSMVSGSKAAAALQEKAGNQINREASGEVASTADRLGRMFKELKNLSGPMSEAINAAAARLTQGEKREKVQRDLYEDVVAAMQAELKRAGLAPKAPSREAATTNLFDSSAPTGMALLERLESRADAMRRRCSTGYGCGSSCISVAKECRSKPASSIGRERIRRLQQLARGEIKPRGLGAPTGVEASSMAQDLEGRRAAQAADLAARRLARSAVPAKPSGALVPTLVRRHQVIGSLGDELTAAVAGFTAAVAGEKRGVNPASATPRLSDVIRESLNAMKAIDARQMARTAENLFEAGWSLERRKKYKGMSKEEAREQFKVEFLRQMEAGSGAVQTKELARAGEKGASTGSVAGAMRSLISEMKGQDKRLADLESASIDLRVRAKNLEIGGTGEPLELTSPSRAAPQIKPAGKAGGLNAQDVSTAKQQAQFARQQRQAAMAAGDRQGAEAWRQEERAVARARVQAAARRAQQSQTSLFGATDYDESLPLFGRRDATLAAIEDRLDALRRKCTTGYGCGSSCISVQKECRARPSSAIGKERIKRLRQLAMGEIKPRGIGVPSPTKAASMAEGLRGARGGKAQELLKQRKATRVANATEKAAKAQEAAKAKEADAGRGRQAPPGTPRGEADRAVKAADPDYEFARPSTVGNVGEDLKGSARHKANQWRSLSEAEADGTAAALVTRDKLLKAEPLDLTEGLTSANYLTRLAGHLALKSFPAQPYTEKAFSVYERSQITGKKTPAEMRKLYYDHLQEVKGIIDRRRDEADPRQMLEEISRATVNRIAAIRGDRSQPNADRFNPLANSLVDLTKKASRGSYSKTSVAGQINTLGARLKRADESKSAAELAELMRNATEDILNGASIDKVTGVKKGGTTFNSADLYVKKAVRVGGRPLAADDSPAGSASVLAQRMGMRGLQFGNSVTDDERAHHLRKTAEAMVDLADVTGLPDRAMSLDGKLGLAFGARGKGRAAAHYEPGTKVINITRKNGVGTLAHEWGHALDDYVGRETPRGQALSHMRGNPIYLSEQTSDLYWDSNGGTKSQADDPVWKAMNGVRKAIEETDYPSTLRQGLRKYGIKAGSPQYGYWISGREVFARTFERYVQHKLQSKGQQNTYLSGLGGNSPLWPSPQQIAQMAPAFDQLMQAVSSHTFGGMERRTDSRNKRIWLFMHAMAG